MAGPRLNFEITTLKTDIFPIILFSSNAPTHSKLVIGRYFCGVFTVNKQWASSLINRIFFSNISAKNYWKISFVRNIKRTIFVIKTFASFCSAQIVSFFAFFEKLKKYFWLKFTILRNFKFLFYFFFNNYYFN